MGPLDDEPAAGGGAGRQSVEPVAPVVTVAPVAPVMASTASTSMAPEDASSATSTGSSARTQPRRETLALLEVIDRDGHVRQAWPISAWPARIGRALDNDIVLTDPHVAAHHFRIEPDGNDLVLRAGATVNGLALGSHRIEADGGARLPADIESTEIVAGRTRMRLRLAGVALAPEQRLSTIAVRPVRVLPTLGLVLALFAGVAFNAYLDADPDNLVRVAGNAVLVGLSAACVWCGGWALLSKTITRQGHLGWHLRVFAIAALALLGLAMVPGLLAFSLSWPWLTDYSFVATFGVGAAALYFHLLAVEPARPRLLRAVVASGALAGIALTLWFNLQRTSRVGDELYMSHLFPPALRLARPLATDRFIEGLGSLRAVLDKKAKEPASADSFGNGAAKGNDDDE